MKKTRVLLVEDDPLVRTTVRLTLESLGYTIVGAAADRCEMLRLLKALTPDLGVINPNVLEKTGMGLVREVLGREHTSESRTPTTRSPATPSRLPRSLDWLLSTTRRAPQTDVLCVLGLLGRYQPLAVESATLTVR